MTDSKFDITGARILEMYRLDHSKLYEILEKFHSAGTKIFIRGKGIGISGELESNVKGGHSCVDIGLLMLGYNCDKNNSEIYLQTLEHEGFEGMKPKINLIDILREYII